jgi:UDP-glucose 4-epimerase
MKSVLVCGGAGYIGSHMVAWLMRRGWQVTVLDNLSTGHRRAVGDVEFAHADLLEQSSLERVFSSHYFDAVMHFCARSLVGESVEQPYEYYANNVCGTLNLLQVMRRHSIKRLVFSSTAAVFGQPMSDTIDESHPKQPINPYGAGKLMVERILADAAIAYGLRSVSLRYFNAAGASTTASIGESHEPESHLIPNILRAAGSGGHGMKVFGDDYHTRDGTCIRDYVHVEDLARAHELALDFLDNNDGAHAFNLGNGEGFSVLEVIAAAESVVDHKIPFSIQPRRIGDPAVLVASSAKARTELGWIPTHRSLDSIISTAWKWHCAPSY